MSSKVPTNSSGSESWSSPSTGVDSTEALLGRCRVGDAGAWRLLVARFERLIRTVARSQGLDVAEVGDVTQSTFEALLRAIDTVREPERLGSWLVTVAKRHSIEVRVRRERQRDASLAQAGCAALAQGAPGFDDGRLGDAEWLLQGMALLPERCRELLMALYFSGPDADYAAVSQRLGIAAGSIGPTRSRCLAKLRELLTTLDGA